MKSKTLKKVNLLLLTINMSVEKIYYLKKKKKKKEDESSKINSG